MKKSRSKVGRRRRKQTGKMSPFLTWCPLQHREHLPFGTGEGDARLATTLLAQDRCVAEKLTGPFLSTHWRLRLLLGFFLSCSLCLQSNRQKTSKRRVCLPLIYLDRLHTNLPPSLLLHSPQPPLQPPSSPPQRWPRCPASSSGSPAAS